MAVLLFAIVVLVCAFTVGPRRTSAASPAEQVIFSTSGWCCMDIVGNSRGITSTPLGFWIWCAADAASNSNGGYQNANACQGSMYFYALGKSAKGIIGQVSEPDEGIYQMNVAQGSFNELLRGTFDPSQSDFLCTLINPSETPTTEVDVQCLFGPGLGGGVGTMTAVTNSVVRVTGP